MSDGSKVSMAEQFLPSVDKLDSGDVKRVMRAVSRFGKDPDHNSLNLHPIKTDSSERLYTFRASDDLRVLAASLGGDRWVVLEAGHHDDLYLRASLGRFVVAADGSSLGFYTADDVDLDGPDRTAIRGDAPADEAGTVLSHWTDAELLAVGFEADEVAAIRACMDPSELLDLDLTDEHAELAIDLIELTPETYARRRESGAARATSKELVEAVERTGAEWGLSSFLEPDELERLLSAPIERWMLFLHPNQKALVTRAYEGPARLGGPAGTGKTVVALHRAAALAQRLRREDPDARVLFTTFVSTLPRVFESLYLQLPNAIPHAVEFVNIDSLARRICGDLGSPVRVDSKKADASFAEAFALVVRPDTPLGRMGLSADYLREEVHAVLKGRDIRRVEDYLDLERTGRRTPLLPQHREQVWELRSQYDRLLGDAGVLDFPDVLLRAHELLGEHEEPWYRAAIIDEAQDLSLAGLRLVRRLVNGAGPDRSDGLMLVGDGAQRIYASCFTLRQAGLEVRGRSTVLQQNYRNTQQVLDAALAVAGDREIDDLGEARRRASESASTLRDGPTPRLVLVDDRDDRSDYLAERIRLLTSNPSVSNGDIAVLVPTNRLAFGMVRALKDHGVLASALKDYEGVTGDSVKVGTYWRAKGLEFKAVMVLGVENFPRPLGNDDDPAAEDRFDLELSALFVAMTRAREHLDLVSLGEPCAQVRSGQRAFELVDRRRR